MSRRDSPRITLYLFLTVSWLATTSKVYGEHLRMASSSTRNLDKQALQIKSEKRNNLIFDSILEDGIHDIRSKQNSSLSNDDLTAIIHIGPMKTGSTAIQRLLNPLQKALAQDNYEIAKHHFGPGNRANNFYKCFKNVTYGSNKYDNTPDDLGDKNDNGCRDETLEYVADIANRGHNLLLSSELLATPERDIDAFQEFLKPWKHVRIVAYYRRYYDWLYSFWDQNQKHQPPSKQKPLVKYLTMKAKFDESLFDEYYVGLIARWQKKFHDVQVYNLHTISGGDVRDHFYCKALIHANHTCTQFESDRAEGRYNQKPNPSHPLVYNNLAYYARDMGLWVEDKNNNITMETVAQAAQHHQEDELNLTALNFTGLQCPDENVLNWVLEKSLLAEKMMIPEYFQKQGEREIREEFERIKHTRYCEVDPRASLQESAEWQEFFKSL